MAGAVYMDPKTYESFIEKLRSLNWVSVAGPLSSTQMVSPVPGKDGFRSMLFSRTNDDGSVEYAYVYAGTDSFADILEDIIHLLDTH